MANELKRGWNIAHRGASWERPENTLPAFERAIELGADLIEIDVRLSADGHLVVVHDEAVGGRRIGASTLAELKEVELAGGTRIPTLAEVLVLTLGRVGLYVDLKDPGAVNALAGALPANPDRPILAGGSDGGALAELRARRPDIPTGIMYGNIDVDEVELARACGASYAHPCWERFDAPHRLLAPERIERVRQCGLGIITWHEERPEELEALLRLGVDGICSDRPDLVEAARRRVRKPAGG